VRHRRGVAGVEDIFGEFFRSGPSPNTRNACPGHGLNGIRLIFAGIPLSSFHEQLLHHRVKSLTPFSITYSKVMRRAFERARIIAARPCSNFGDRVFAVQRQPARCAVSSRTACSENRQHGRRSPRRYGTMFRHPRPRSTSVIRRSRKSRCPRYPTRSGAHRATAIEIVERLAPLPHHDDIGDEAVAGWGFRDRPSR